MLKLLAVHRDGSEKVLHVQPGETEVLGRRAPRLALEDSCVSREHARVWFEDDCWWLNDLDSTHGTWVNHDPVDRPTPLHVGDEIRLGRMLLVVRGADAKVGEPPQTAEAGGAPHRHAAADRQPPADDAPLQADEVIIAPSVSLDASAADAHPQTPRAWPEPWPAFGPDTDVTFTEPRPADERESRPEEDIDPLADDQARDPDATPTTLSAAAQHDPVAGNFGVIFPQVGRPGSGRHSHPRHAARPSDAGRRHARWVTWTAVAVAGTMAAVATTALLLYPG